MKMILKQGTQAMVKTHEQDLSQKLAKKLVAVEFDQEVSGPEAFVHVLDETGHQSLVKAKHFVLGEQP